MYNHNKAQQSKNRVHISWDILYVQAQMAEQFLLYAYEKTLARSRNLILNTNANLLVPGIGLVFYF